ncbi:alpha-ketoglutarate-dependent dioxygenase alkB homolog 7, mitochondrial isoform X1 [Scomber scombrus]|uniref:alpha-ketoglutarate-dependent dioxygenase alkB homolog 7, mitochondrial isoform X1 n=1 Tax=Scomber scombrus TaxID=13677 RepID=UPI002DDC4846|nr:alpha-ketoglutarate-dependent dioxygenase alkB homolog 7, mitochondrial isoform X1 [Scomber scombrus]
MKLLLAVVKRLHRPAVCCSPRRALSSCAGSGGLLAAEGTDTALVVGSSQELLHRIGSQVEVRTGFISEEEEEAFLRELELGLKKKRYQFDHWDDAIHGYRETERVRWGAECEEVLTRVRSIAFAEGSPLLGPVHVLDLDKTGYIKPHIDSVKVNGQHLQQLNSNNASCIFSLLLSDHLLIFQFCGTTIAGLSLLSDSIMRLVKEDASSEWLDMLLPRRSLYILRDQARYDFTHEILKDEESVFNGQKVPRQRRIAVICRNLPG